MVRVDIDQNDSASTNAVATTNADLEEEKK